MKKMFLAGLALLIALLISCASQAPLILSDTRQSGAYITPTLKINRFLGDDDWQWHIVYAMTTLRHTTKDECQKSFKCLRDGIGRFCHHIEKAHYSEGELDVPPSKRSKARDALRELDASCTSMVMELERGIPIDVGFWTDRIVNALLEMEQAGDLDGLEMVY